jgi:hypothetical protein
MEKRCRTCHKRKVDKYGQRPVECQVLSEMIGLHRDCFAWSNDPLWEQKVAEAVRRYAEKREGGIAS